MSGFLERYGGILTVALVLIASLRIAATYTVFSHTSDEIAHVACGMEWLAKGIYTWEPQHPPLARVAIALGPIFPVSGRRKRRMARFFRCSKRAPVSSTPASITPDPGAGARWGFFRFSGSPAWRCTVWGRRYFSRAVAVVAVFLFTFIPTVLAHSSVATTDMALTAFMTASFLTGLIWVERPTAARGVWFGVCAGLMVLSKFSCLAFFPAIVALALAGYFIVERPGIGPVLRAARARVPTFGLAVLIALVVIWAGYRFSFGEVPFGGLSLPFPELYAGIQEVRNHAANGHPCFLLGEIRDTGFWNFYLVGLFYKSPLAFLALLGIGLVLTFWKYRSRGGYGCRWFSPPARF